MSIKKGTRVFVAGMLDRHEARTEVVTAVGRKWVTVGRSRYSLFASSPDVYLQEKGGGLMWPDRTAYDQWTWATAARKALDKRLYQLSLAQLTAINAVVDLGEGKPPE